MKTALLRFLHLFMATAVLLSSMGFGLVEHSCQMRGKQIYSVYTEARPGCSQCRVAHDPQPVPTVQRATCCQDEARFTNVDTGASLTHLSAKFIKTAAIAGTDAGTFVAAVFGWPVYQPIYTSAAAYTSPPPPFGRQLLLLVRLLLI